MPDPVAIPVPASPAPVAPVADAAPAVVAPVDAGLPVPVEATPPVVEPVAPTPPASLLAETAPAEKPPEPAATVEAPAAEPAVEPVPEPAPEAPIVYEKFNFGEGVTVAEDDPGLTKFIEVAQGHKLPQEAAQQLATLYGEQATKYATDLQQTLTQRQFDVFADTVKGWQDKFRSDPEFKNRTETVLNDAKWMISEFGGSDAQQAELRAALDATGAGSHPALIRVLANAAKRLREARPGPRPVSQSVPSVSPADRRYGNGRRGA